MYKVGNIITKYQLREKPPLNVPNTVNSKDTNTVNSMDKYVDDSYISREGVAKHISEYLGDEKSFKYYLLLANNYNPNYLLKALSVIKSARESGKHINHLPVYFQGILKKWGMKTKFT